MLEGGSFVLVPCAWFLVLILLRRGERSGGEAFEAKRDALGRRPGGVVNAGVNAGQQSGKR